MSEPGRRTNGAGTELLEPLPGAGREAAISPQVEIVGIERRPLDADRLVGAELDRPREGDGWSGHTLSLAGWALGTDVPAVAVDLVHEGRVLRKVPLAMQRGDVIERHGDRAGGRARCGFRTSVTTIGLPDPFEVLVRIVFDDGGLHPLALIRGRHHGLETGYEPALRPIGVTTLGRTGSTWLMKLLGAHPEVAVHGGYPFETRSAAYWLHMVRVLSDPANPLQSSHPDAFSDDLWSIGHHPFHRESLIDEPELWSWFAGAYPARLAELAQRSIDEFYGRVAAGSGRPDAIRFAEKLVPGHIPWLMWELYPDAGEILLVRDFRDMACSILAFNEKRGFVAFGRENVGSDAEFIERNLRAGAHGLLKSWRQRQDRLQLLRYEDLVLEPETTLETLCEGLGLAADPGTIAGVLEGASRPDGALAGHRTARDPRASIERWRTELSPELVSACRTAFAEPLEAFGYALD